ncbi:MAG: helix-turn-helix domain-containing protein [Formivibrio sp.]|nr:helix-turn-helix domain-containing protein [Formivibrio sp.]
MNLIQIGRRIRDRREELGLSQDRLAKLGGLSRVTVNQLETGAIVDLGVSKLLNLLDLLGLALDAHARPARGHGLGMASRTASVSYKRELSSSELSHALGGGALPIEIAPHVATLLDEAPLQIIVSAVEEAAQQEHVAPKAIWRHVIKWAHELQSPRKVWA